MAAGSDSSFAADVLPSAWTTERLKKFVKEKGILVSGLKHELVMKANNFIETEALESELDVKTFKDLQVVQSVSFEVLPKTGWRKELPKISEDLACKYLRKLGGYTKNFRTGVRLCQVGMCMISKSLRYCKGVKRRAQSPSYLWKPNAGPQCVSIHRSIKTSYA